MYYLAVKNETMLEPVFGNVIYPFIILIMSCTVGVFLNKLIEIKKTIAYISMSHQPYKKQNPKLVQKEFIIQHTTMSMSTNGLG
jgi:hypothetical protein